MNYGDLKDYILTDTHRADMVDEVEGFIRRAEGLIRRELKGYELTATLDESDRVADGVYTLPSNVLQLRTVTSETSGIEYRLDDVGLSNIKNLPDSLTAQAYAVRGDSIEFRGVPATDQEFTLHYFGHPDALSADDDENDLLTNHEELYIAGAEFYLWLRIQELELAENAFERFSHAITQLNEQVSQKVGGGGTVGAYNLGNFRVGRSY